MNSKYMCRLLFHVFTSIMYFCAIVKYEFLPLMPHRKAHEHFAGRFKYLTYWNLIVHFLFFALSSWIDLKKPSSKNYYEIARLRDKFFGGIVLPYGIFVFCMFWGLYIVDRELIFPKALDSIFPPWLNHVSHTVLVPVLLVEMYILKHHHPRRKDGMMYTMAFGLAYALWTLYLGIVMDIWVYPILQILNWVQRGVFISLSICVIFSMYLIGEKINCFIWGKNIIRKTK